MSKRITDFPSAIGNICDDAIDDSIRFSDIQTIDGGQAECDYLELLCEASVEHDYLTLFWGVLKGKNWCVRVDHFDADNVEVEA